MRFQSLMMELGTPIPEFSLPDTDGRRYCQDDFDPSKLLFVIFMCNHCPFVLHILDGILRYTTDYAQGVASVAISSNDVLTHPEDGPEAMRRLANERGLGFPYLYDETQGVALAFGAVCTPDLFLFDRQRRLAYRGRFDGSRPITPHDRNPGRAAVPVTGEDLRRATESLLSGTKPDPQQQPSVGCSMKWKPGNDPDGGAVIPPS
jgi:peroxiredoxin